RYFPHIVNLACKAILAAITKMKYIHACNTCPQYAAAVHNPIAIVQSLVQVICASSLWCQEFSSILESLGLKDLQLICDVDTRWSSTYLMIECILELEEGVKEFIEQNGTEEIQKYKLSDPEWATLKHFKAILAVPHAFQQKLPHEKTPTLCYALPSFEGMMGAWEKLKNDNPDLTNIIQAGLDKLEAYHNRTDVVPAYIFSMSMY
ncbi:hypothetical protein BDQ12DRAFT_611422, partial [Crucibulum laeve]